MNEHCGRVVGLLALLLTMIVSCVLGTRWGAGKRGEAYPLIACVMARYFIAAWQLCLFVSRGEGTFGMPEADVAV